MVQLTGVMQPKSAPLTLGFAADRLQVPGTLDGSVQPIHNTGVLPLGSETMVGDAIGGAGRRQPAGGEVRQTGAVTLADRGGGRQRRAVGDVGVVATCAGATAVRLERFVNSGTLRTTGHNDINAGDHRRLAGHRRRARRER